MKKRLRKKKYRGEFQQLCWQVTCRLKDDSPAAYENFWEPLVDKIDELSLMMAGGENDFITAPAKRLSVAQTLEKQQQLQQWLQQRPEIAEATAGPLIDAWYGSGQRQLVAGEGIPNVLAAKILTMAGISF